VFSTKMTVLLEFGAVVYTIQDTTAGAVAPTAPGRRNSNSSRSGGSSRAAAAVGAAAAAYTAAGNGFVPVSV
jgi:hypothetical protein